MRNKNQKGFGLVEVIVFGTLLSIVVMIYMSWSQILKRSINHMDQKINLDATDTIIERYLDCCRTYVNYFLNYPANVPLDDSMFIYGPVTLYDSGDNPLAEFVKPWVILGLPGGSALEINYSETRPNKDYLSRNISNIRSREKFSGRDRNLKCSYNINYCGGGGGTSTGGTGGPGTGTGSSSSSSSSSSGSGGTGGTTGSGSSTSSSSSSSSGGSSGGSTGSPTSGSFPTSSSSSSGSTGSSSSGGSPSSSSGGGSTGGSSSGGRGICNFSASGCGCPLPSLSDACSIVPCQGPNCPHCQNLCMMALDTATNPNSLPKCSDAGCNAGGGRTCECAGTNEGLCQAGKWLAAAQTCHSDITVIDCWKQCHDSLQQQVLDCAACCTGLPLKCLRCACVTAD